MSANDLHERLRIALEADFGCGVGEVDMTYGPICSSPVHIGAPYTTFGCQFARNVANNVGDAIATDPRLSPGSEATS